MSVLLFETSLFIMTRSMLIYIQLSYLLHKLFLNPYHTGVHEGNNGKVKISIGIMKKRVYFKIQICCMLACVYVCMYM